MINFIFYVTQVYIPRQNLTRQANCCIQERIQNVVDKMDDIFRRIVEKYDGKYDKCCTTREKLLDVLHKMRINDGINVVAASRAFPVHLNESSYFTVREWIITRLEFVEHDIDCIFKYYSFFVTPYFDLMKELESLKEQYQ